MNICASLVIQVKKEFEEYKEDLSKKDISLIILKSYETAIKKEFVQIISNIPLNDQVTEKLLSLEYPLDYIYNQYLDTESYDINYELKEFVTYYLHDKLSFI